MKPDTTRLKHLSAAAQHQIDAGNFSSIEWHLQHRGQSIDSGLLGHANAAAKSALPANPIYRIYSMTKPIVAVAALILVERGKLLLPAPVSHYLPAVSNAKILASDGSLSDCESPMLIEHLLTHRAGFSYDFLPDCTIAERYREQNLAEDGSNTLAQLVSKLVDTPLCHQPGSAWRYSYSIDVLAHILELVCDKPIQTILDELVFQPCGMPDTGFSVDAQNQQRLLTMYGQRPLGAPMGAPAVPQPLNELNVDAAHPVNSPDFARGGHGLYSTANDYSKFMPVLASGKTSDGNALLSAPMWKFMWSDRIPPSQQPLKIGPNALSGYGWNLFGRVVQDLGQAQFLTTATEGGWAGAASTYFWIDPENEINGVVMTQYLGSGIPLGDLIRTTAYQSFIP